MFYVFLVLLLFVSTVMSHILFCRKTNKQVLHAKAFILIAIIFLGIYVLLAEMPLMTAHLDTHSLWGLPFKITSGVIFILFIPIYLCFYVLTQLTSPSKKILLSISKQGESSYAEILASVEEENFITSRLSDLCASGCVAQTNGLYILTSEGQKIAATLNMMQLILGRKVGG